MSDPREDPTYPGTREARRDRVSRTTSSSAIASAAGQLTSASADVEEVLTRLYEIGREQGRLMGQGDVQAARLEAANAKERATRYSMWNTEVRGVASRLRDDGVEIPPELVAVIWPKEVG